MTWQMQPPSSLLSDQTSLVTSAALRAISLLLGIACMCTISFCASGQQNGTFFADLAFHFDCKGDAYPVSDRVIEQFLQDRGFTALDVVRVRRDRKMAPMLSELFIDGIDRQQRMIRFMADPPRRGSYVVLLNTPPPTHHDADLEEALLAFASNTLKCHVREISRRENDIDARHAYNEYFKKVEEQFRQAENWLRPPI
jgi:hypothetical protein